jgi:3-hydroxyisobutyrate dehydrogenase-like beta-hydroxyacid dehydrogenase
MAIGVGFIGLGIMGSRMAANLQKHGYALTVHNRTRAKAEPLLLGGAAWAETPAAVAEGAGVLITMLAHPEAVRDMALGEHGFLEHLKPGAFWIDCSTVNPSFSREMAAQAQAQGVRFLDAPAAGTKGPAAAGELTFFVGGDAADLEACRPLLAAMGRRIVHAGGTGMGSTIKMVNNLLLAEAMAAFAEGLALGESLGVPRGVLLDTLVGGPVTAPFLAGKKAKIATGDYEPEFPLRWMVKDLHLASVTAYEQGLALPVGHAAKELYALAARQGLPDLDFAAICEYLGT